MQHRFDAQIFVDIGPMDAFTVADDPVPGALFWRRCQEPRRPGKWDADDPPVQKTGRDQPVLDAH
jgi:hypothetical protein